MESQVRGKMSSRNSERHHDSISYRQTTFDTTSERLSLMKNYHWSFSSKDTMRFTHAIHPYVASMNPHLASELISRYVPAGGTVLDPFVGGGTVLVEALVKGIKSFGIDVNPLAVLVSKAKTTYIPRSEMLRVYHDILAKLPIMKERELDFPKSSRISYWFKPYMHSPLTKLSRLIREIPTPELRTLFLTALSATVRDVSLTYRGEVRLRHLREAEAKQFNPDVLEKFRQRVQLAIDRISKLPKDVSTNVEYGDAKSMPFGEREFNAIICSPPYGDDRNGVSYFQFSKNMLYWLGFSEEEISDAKGRFLGESRSSLRPPASDTLNSAVTTIKQNPISSNPNAIEECIAFYSDYDRSLREMSKVCSGPIIIVIGDRRLSKTFIDNAKITTELMSNRGWRLVDHFHRVIEKKRIPVMQPNGGKRDVSGGGLINLEHTLVYRPD